MVRRAEATISIITERAGTDKTEALPEWALYCLGVTRMPYDSDQLTNIDAALQAIAQPNKDGVILLPSGVVTANGVSSDITNARCRGVKVFITTGTFGASESTMTVSILGKDPISGIYYPILTSAALVASKDPSNSPILTVYPGLVAVANVTASDILPPTFRVTWQATAWGTGGSTLGISASLQV